MNNILSDHITLLAENDCITLLQLKYCDDLIKIMKHAVLPPMSVDCQNVYKRLHLCNITKSNYILGTKKTYIREVC